MPAELAMYLLLFFMCSFLGWCMEVVCKLIQFRRFINRGFLLGPICPIYGTGAVMMAYFLPRWTTQTESTFLLALVLCGGLEYATSWGMEKLFHARWWDYSQKRFNINGRVCADNLLAFGIMGVLVVKFLKPFSFSLFGQLSATWLNALSIGLSALMLCDIVLSAGALSRIRVAAESIRADSTEAITRAVREALLQNFLLRRLLQAYPEVQLYNKEMLRRIQERRNELSLSMLRKRIALLEELQDMENKRKSQRK